MDNINQQITDLLKSLANGGAHRLKLVLDIRLEQYELLHDNDRPVNLASSKPSSKLGRNVEEPETSEFVARGEPVYEINRNTTPPRLGSMNSIVLRRLMELPQRFTRPQFEAVIPNAMKYNSQTEEFGVSTNFQNIKRAQQAYFSEFKKRRWISPVNQTFTP